MNTSDNLNLPRLPSWRRNRLYAGITGLIIVLLAGGIFFLTIGERGKPIITVSPTATQIGQKAIFTITFADDNSGLLDATITISQHNRTHTLFKEEYRGEKVTKKSISFLVEPRLLKLGDGPATLSISAHDNSVWKNHSVLNMMITIDVTPPQIFLLTPTTYIKPGGTGMVLLRTSEPVTRAGIMVNDEFFPAFPITINGKGTYVAYFALPIDIPSERATLNMCVQDRAGNEALGAVPHTVLKRTFRHDKLTLSDQFLQSKMPEFATLNPSLKDKDPLSIFIYVNTDMRAENDRIIRSLCQQSELQQLWDGPFLRMKNASPMAQFGDRRTYIYHGKEVGTSVHLGVDLASTAQAPIEAANNGRVVFCGTLGIYGNTIILDHGQGIFSLYGHLSAITAKRGEMVNKGTPIGASGQTGLAAGDHLHFSILVNGRFVDPREWWDAHWIADNILKKFNEAR